MHAYLCKHKILEPRLRWNPFREASPRTDKSKGLLLRLDQASPAQLIEKTRYDEHEIQKTGYGN